MAFSLLLSPPVVLQSECSVARDCCLYHSLTKCMTYLPAIPLPYCAVQSLIHPEEDLDLHSSSSNNVRMAQTITGRLRATLRSYVDGKGSKDDEDFIVECSKVKRLWALVQHLMFASYNPR